MGISRAHKYGLSFQEYVESANSSSTILIQIEHIDAVSNLDSILSVQGIDGVFIGPYDLSGSLNRLGQVKDQKVQTAIDEIKQKCRSKDIPYGIFGGTPEALKKEIEEGCNYVLAGIDVMNIAQICKSNLQKLREIQNDTE